MTTQTFWRCCTCGHTRPDPSAPYLFPWECPRCSGACESFSSPVLMVGKALEAAAILLFFVLLYLGMHMITELM